MANYTVPNSSYGTQQSLTTTYKTLCVTAASTQALGTNGTMLRRGLIYDILVGTNGTPADNYVEWCLARCTAVANSTAATGTSISSVSSAFTINPADGTVAGQLSVNSSAETNFTSVNIVWYVGVNQRASYRWVAAPGSEFVYPAVSSGTGGNALILRAQSGAYTGTATGTVLLSEQ